MYWSMKNQERKGYIHKKKIVKKDDLINVKKIQIK